MRHAAPRSPKSGSSSPLLTRAFALEQMPKCLRRYFHACGRNSTNCLFLAARGFRLLLPSPLLRPLSLGLFSFAALGVVSAEQGPQMAAAARSVLPPETITAPAAAPHVETSGPSSKHRSAQQVRTTTAVHVTDVAVVVPAGQKQAIDALLASVQHGEVMADVLRAEKPELPLPELEVSPLAISPIEIKPLEDGSAEMASPNEKTRRSARSRNVKRSVP